MRAGIVAPDGTLVARTEARTEASRGPAAVIDALATQLAALSAPYGTPDGIGVAAAGQIDPATGVVVQAPNLGWHEIPLRASLESATGTRVIVENDVRAAAWGEFRHGAGQGTGSLVAVFVGTGVGSGAVLNGALWHGAGNAAGEVGHTQVVIDGLPCRCGQRGCMEQYGSGSGLQRRFAATPGREASRLHALCGGDPGHLTALMVEQAARAGDPLAAEMWRDAEQYLTMGITNYVTVINPSMLVLGGGVIETVPRLFQALADGVPRLTTVLARSLQIERARLGDWSGVIGAAALAASTS
jgi:glucokinase